MAMTCSILDRECDGCMTCYTEAEPIRCPVCDAVAEVLYKQEGIIIGCNVCVEVIDAWDF